MVQIRRAIREAGKAGSSSTTEARSLALPACSDRFADFVGLQDFLVEPRWIERARSRDRLLNIGKLAVRIDQRLCNGPIDEAGIEVPQPVMERDALAERTLARRSRSVDGDDHTAI